MLAGFIIPLVAVGPFHQWLGFSCNSDRAEIVQIPWENQHFSDNLTGPFTSNRCRMSITPHRCVFTFIRWFLLPAHIPLACTARLYYVQVHVSSRGPVFCLLSWSSMLPPYDLAVVCLQLQVTWRNPKWLSGCLLEIFVFHIVWNLYMCNWRAYLKINHHSVYWYLICAESATLTAGIFRIWIYMTN